MNLTPENYSKGFLMDEELMGGVAEHPTLPGKFLGYVLRHTTGEYLGYQDYSTLEAALAALNAIPRAWSFEKSSGCGSCADGNCGKDRGGGCHKKSRTSVHRDAQSQTGVEQGASGCGCGSGR